MGRGSLSVTEAATRSDETDTTGQPVASIVVPTFNEAENIAELLERLHVVMAGERFEVLVVDDNSPDETWRIAEEVGSRLGSIRVIRRIDENGLSSAIIRGMQEAAGAVICVIDADMQHDESVLPAMVEQVVNGADVCVGSRKAAGGGYGEWSMARRFVSWGATVIAKTATGTRVSDPMSGFFAVRSDYFMRVAPELNPRGFKVLLELLARGNPNRVEEVGYVFRERTRGETKLNSGVVYEYLLGIIDLRLGRVVSSQTVSYMLVTFVGMIVNLVGYLGARSLDISRTTAAIIGFEIALVANFVLNNAFTFRSLSYRGLSMLRGLLFFQIISLYGMVIQFSVFRTLKIEKPFSSVSYGGSVTANAIGIICAALATYFLHRRYTWSRLNQIGGAQP